jgi:hypothetical protein
MLWDGMGILWAEMLPPNTCHVQQDHDLPKQHVVQMDAFSESLLSFKNDGDGDRRFVHWVRDNVPCTLQKA